MRKSEVKVKVNAITFSDTPRQVAIIEIYLTFSEMDNIFHYERLLLEILRLYLGTCSEADSGSNNIW